MPVMVTGGPYVENSEWRVRSRVAVHSGLTTGGYIPRDAEHVGFVSINLDGVSPLVIPCEWFQLSDMQTADRNHRRRKNGLARSAVEKNRGGA